MIDEVPPSSSPEGERIAPQIELFPIQRVRNAKAHPLLIPWSVAEKAYSVYSAQYGTGQSLEHIAKRGGFYPDEMDAFHPTWREEASEITALKAALLDLIASWRQTCVEIGPRLEGAAFEQCANQLDAILQST